MDAYLLGHALEFAVAAHGEQVDKSGTPYVGHLLAVASRVVDHGTDAVVAALLHDVVEDTSVSMGDIAAEFMPNIAAAVEALTHREGEAYEDYLHRVQQNELAVIVKRADLEHNLSPERELPDQKWQARARARYLAALEQLQAPAASGGPV